MVSKKLLICLLPLLVFLSWWVFRLFTGKKPHKAQFNTALSLVLLVYFLLVSGTGVFWVAAQELPVFDWHYLPAYLFLMLGLLHVFLHRETLLRFFRSPASQIQPETQQGMMKGQFKFLIYGVLVIGCLGIAFFWGRVSVSQRLRETRMSPVSLSLAQYYHEGSAHPNTFSLPRWTLQAQPQSLKTYPGNAKLVLPETHPPCQPTLLEAHQSWKSGELQESSLNLQQLTLLLYHTQGINKIWKLPQQSYALRTAPSAGALYPVNVYILAREVRGLEAGLYYYDPHQSALIRLKPGSSIGDLAAATAFPEAILSAPATILFTSTFGRTAYKYKERAYRYVHNDTGHAAFNLAHCAAALGFRSPMIARFDDDRINQYLGIQLPDEAALLLQPIGSTPSPNEETRFLRAPMVGQAVHFLDVIHAGSSFRCAPTSGPRFFFPAVDPPNNSLIPLPPPREGKSLFVSIQERRSRRRFSDEAMDMAELSALCSAASTQGSQDPLISGSAPLALYLAVRKIKDLPSGLYRYKPNEHALASLQQGDFSGRLMEACLQQDFCGTAQVVFIKTVKWDQLLLPDGDRGYRYAHIRAGFVGEGFYLQATALGLGVCGVGAFGDQELGKILQLDSTQEIPLYITVVGKL